MNKLSPILVGLLFATSVAAQTTTQRAPTTTPREREGREQRQDLRQNLQQNREELRSRLEQQKQEFRAKRDELKTQFEQKQEELKTRAKAERDALKERLKTVRDERKKQAVERIDERVRKLNEERLRHFSRVLDQIERVLDRIRDRTDRAADRDLDVSAVRDAITQAETAIVSARQAVTAQAGKTYALTVNTEAALKQDVGNTRKALHDDLMKVFEAVKAAREAVRRAATTLAQIPRVNEVPELPATSTPATSTPPAATSTPATSTPTTTSQ